MNAPRASFRYPRPTADVLFAVLLILSGWLPAYLMMSWKWDVGWNLTGESAWLLLATSLGPGLAAVVAASFRPAGMTECLGWRLGKPFYLLPAWLLFPILGGLASAVTVFAGFAEWDWTLSAVRTKFMNTPAYTQGAALWGMAILIGPVYGLIPAWAEESAWRGYLYHRLPTRNFWPSALLTGAAWWAWRAPLFLLGYLYAEKSLLALGMGLVFALETGILLTWLRSASGGILAPALARGTLTTSALIPMSLTDLSFPLWGHLTGAIGLGIMALFIAGGAAAGVFRDEAPRPVSRTENHTP